MPEPTPRSLSHFALYHFSQRYFELTSQDRRALGREWLAGLRAAAPIVFLYQAFPVTAGADVLVWSALPAEDPGTAAQFFEAYACATNPQRRYIEPVDVYWGFTKPSQYTKTRSTQEIDPFAATRQTYLVMYPFTKTADWYLKSRETRQGMMNEHIRIGKSYPEITQLLLYSFGLQDHEFIVVYETQDLVQFSDLVYELRSSEARLYTLRDTPLFTGVFHPAEETLALWEGEGKA